MNSFKKWFEKIWLGREFKDTDIPADDYKYLFEKSYPAGSVLGFLGNLKEFYLKEWKWVWGIFLTIIGLILGKLKS